MTAGLAGALAIYVAAMLVVAALARRAQRDDSLADFYLAGRDLGGFTLLMTLFATQYSGNTLLGYPGEAYRAGFSWVMSVGFMAAIVVVYLLFVPRLHAHAKRFAYLTPADWIRHRFQSPPLTAAANVLIVAAISNYLLAQLMAAGHVLTGATAGEVPYWVGVLLLAVVILIYETAGGMRAVAWTDAVQGCIMLAGLAGIMVVVWPTPSNLGAVTEWIAAHEPSKTSVPTWTGVAAWLSTLVLIGFSAAVYPQAIQRVYAARTVRTLRRSLAVMVFMPLVTIVPVLLVGIVSIPQIVGVDAIAADQVMPLLLARWADASPGMYALAVLVVLAVVAAIMSTADSVLLTLSSILAKDVIAPLVPAGTADARLTRIGKLLSWAIVGVLVIVALVPRITLWGLLQLKMELLIQVSPLFVLGVTWRALTARAALAGLVAGVAVSLALPAAGYSRPFGVHDGVIGWVVNLGLCWLVSRRSPSPVSLSPSPLPAGDPSPRPPLAADV